MQYMRLSPRRNTLRIIAIAALCAVMLTTACARRDRIKAEPLDADLNIAAAPFTQAEDNADLIYGVVPPKSQLITGETLTYLDQVMSTRLAKTAGGGSYPGADATRECTLSTMPEPTGTPGRALDYWARVGQCAGFDYLLVPVVSYWSEREGGELGSPSPASVVLDFFVVDTREVSVIDHYRYEEQQVALAENLLTVDKFMKRGGRFITARELAAEGIATSLTKLGL
ncbi:hypothetical protein DPQ33_13655 [Oceanidesulfovibrio indonesiensis]|uniref:Lipoprotein n=1 Tax=Oceanidesulfovibrio indonesiensis TaxID=54767 RepID=A0A7M3MD34_9BACT|nr:hypothetical protein [Oceanidesulfovibrio indonesiensis]TVM16003.1 hypothetical protein DPQ33_13655 [Oceanidesulfovibrio indonesiensis]